MPFLNSRCVVVAHSDGAAPVIVASPLGGVEVAFNGLAGNTWTLTGGALENPPGSLVFGFDPASVCSIAHNGPDVGLTKPGVLTIDYNSPQIQAALLAGGVLKLTVELEDGPGDPVITDELTVTLHALKSNEFMLGADGAVPQRAIVAHRLGLAGDNFPAGLTSADFSLARVLMDDGALYAENVTLTPQGHLNFSTVPPPIGSSGSLRLELTDTTTALKTTLACEVHMRTHLLFMTDRSGSMNAALGTGSKWALAAATAEFFSFASGVLHPRQLHLAGTPSIAATHRVGYSTFTWSGGALAVSAPVFTASNASALFPVAPGPGGGTPIGAALATGAAALAAEASGLWFRRRTILLTDGMDNSGTPRLPDGTVVTPAAYSADHFPSLADSPTAGIVFHAVSFARDTDTPVLTLEDLVESHDGAQDFTFGTTASGTADVDLRAVFLNLLGDMFPLEQSSLFPVSGASVSVPVEDGVEKAIIVVNSPGGISVSGSGGPVGINGVNSHFSWTILEGALESSYTVDSSAISAGNVTVFYDVSLRSAFGAVAPGIGQPIRLWGELRYQGRRISGARVTATGKLPRGSLGEVLTQALKEGLLEAALKAKLIDREMFEQALAIAAGAQAGKDVPTVRTQLLSALEKLWESGLGTDLRTFRLKEVAPGRYEYDIPASETQNEHTYSFDFSAAGVTPTGTTFRRGRRRSFYLRPTLSPALSTVQSAITSPQTQSVTVVPVNTAGKPVGPGMMPALQFHYADPEGHKRWPLLQTVDNLNGSYSTTVAGEAGRFPKVGLVLGSPTPGNPIILVKGGKRPAREVMVELCLNAIQILDDKDPCVKGSGEVQLFSTVVPAGDRQAAQRRSLPKSGYYQVKEGGKLHLGEVLFRGLVEVGSVLTLSIAARELDWPASLDAHDEYTRYVRRLPVTEGNHHFAPGDEKLDPESLKDWRLWTTMKVTAR